MDFTARLSAAKPPHDTGWWNVAFTAEERKLYPNYAKAMVLGTVMSTALLWLLFLHSVITHWFSDTVGLQLIFLLIGVPLSSFYIWDVTQLRKTHIWRDVNRYKRVLWMAFYNIVVPHVWLVSYLFLMRQRQAISLFELFIYITVSGLLLLIYVGGFKRIFMVAIIVCSATDMLVYHWWLGPMDAFYYRFYVAIVLLLTLLFFLQSQNTEASMKNKQASAMLVNKVAIQNAKLLAVHATQNAYLSAASHDLRQPLQALTLIAHRIQRENQDILLYEPLTRMEMAIDALNNSFDTMLNLSRLNSDTLRHKPSSFAVQQLFDRIKSEYMHTAKQKGIVLNVAHSKVWLHTDEGMLYSVLSNLVSNALRYTENGTVLVGLRRRTFPHCELCVYDTGVGIAPSQIHGVFDEFKRLNYAKQRVRGGVGLGLAISKRMAQILGASLFVRSEEGRGSVFGIHLNQQIIHEQSALKVELLGGSDGLRHTRMALIEDDSEGINDLYELLTHWGVKVQVIPSLAWVQAYCEQNQAEGFDLIISDFHIGMNKPSGLQMMQTLLALQQKFQQQSAVCLLLTGDTSSAISEQADALGVEVLYKPIRPKRLYHHLNQLLQARAQA